MGIPRSALHLAFEGVALGLAIGASEIWGAASAGSPRLQRRIRAVPQQKGARVPVGQADRKPWEQRVIALARQEGGVAEGDVPSIEMQHLDSAPDLRRRVGRGDAEG